MTLPLRSALGLLVMIVMVGVCTVLGWRFLFRTEAVVKHYRQRYDQSTWGIPNWIGHPEVKKSWYPTYIRAMGIFWWVLGLLIVAFFFPDIFPCQPDMQRWLFVVAVAIVLLRPTMRVFSR